MSYCLRAKKKHIECQICSGICGKCYTSATFAKFDGERCQRCFDKHHYESGGMYKLKDAESTDSITSKYQKHVGKTLRITGDEFKEDVEDILEELKHADEKVTYEPEEEPDDEVDEEIAKEVKELFDSMRDVRNMKPPRKKRRIVEDDD